MARIVSKSRKKPDIVVTPSNTSKTASLVNEVFNDFFITDHTPCLLYTSDAADE